MIVEARTAVQQVAASVLERLVRFTSDLVDRLKAIAGESRHSHENAPGSLLRQSHQGLLGVWFQPFLSAKERLKSLCPLSARPGKSLNQSRSGSLDVRSIRVAGLSVADRD